MAEKEEKTVKKKGILSKLSAHCYLLIVLLALPLFFTPLDLKIYDIFLRTLPPLTESGKVWVLSLDDDSMELAGGFPFRREVMADVIILLKELGAESITFDLSYLDESPYSLDPDYAEQVLIRYLEEYIAYDNRIINSLEEALAYLIRDADTYFANALGFTNRSFLTLTMIGREDLFDENVLPPVPQGETAVQMQRVALADITANSDTKTPEMAGVMPAITKLLQQARSAGTVNAGPDTDGIRRRIHLLMKLHGNYYGNLAIAGMREFLGSPQITVNNSVIILKDAFVNGIQRDIRIPRTRDGSVLLKWPNKSFYDYNMSSLYDFIRHTILEQHLVENFYIMEDWGFFSFYDGQYNPLDLYIAAENIKNELLEQYCDVLSKEWLNLRREFFAVSEDYLSGGYEDILLDLVAGDEWLEDYVQELFTATRNQFNRMISIRQNAAFLEGAFCVIGLDATSMIDVGTTPFAEDFPNVGTYAVLANMLLSGEFLSEAPLFVSVLIALIFSFAVVFAANHLRSGRSLAAGLGILILAVMLLGFFHLTKIYIASAVPLVATSLSFLLVTIINFLGANREKAFLHSAFSRYLSPQVLSEIIADPSKLNLGGEKREMTAIFTDVQGFSTFSEKLDPTQLVRLLNKYLTAMSNIIMENIGTIDKYEGDAIIAFFGAPLTRADHAALACRSSIAMKRAEVELNKIFLEEGLIQMPIFTRIGINTGDMVVGNMGAENKMDYTIMGNAVNLAARLEGVNKYYKTGGILISEYTHEQAGEGFICRKLDRVRVVGIKTPLRLYELLALESEADDDMYKRLERWNKALSLFEEREFSEAAKMFSALHKDYPSDHVAEFYAGRSTMFMENPPDSGWDGVNNLTEK